MPNISYMVYLNIHTNIEHIIIKRMVNIVFIYTLIVFKLYEILLHYTHVYVLLFNCHDL